MITPKKQNKIQLITVRYRLFVNIKKNIKRIQTSQSHPLTLIHPRFIIQKIERSHKRQKKYDPNPSPQNNGPLWKWIIVVRLTKKKKHIRSTLINELLIDNKLR